MGPKQARRRSSRTRTIESLEDRRVMSADPLAGLLGGTVQQHGFRDADSSQQPPALVQHLQRDADFWIDRWSERDSGRLLGDIEQTLASAHGVTGLTQVRNDYGFIGTGQTVAIIDSGIAWDHFALGGGFGADYRVVGGWDVTEENDAVPYDDATFGGHGTHVAGIVGADRSGTSDDGVAPGVDLVSLRVFNDVGDGYFHWVEDALQWVHQNRSAFANPITAVNLSLGTSWNSTSVPSWANLEEEFAQLEADGIFITVSAGNSFSTYNAVGLSYPAASPYVVPVMSVDDSGALSSFSQRHPIAIAAPGRSIVSTIPDYIGNQNGVTDDFASFSGTSMAAPYVAGASVILREAMQFVGYANITQDTIFDHMMATATTFFDAATSLSYKRLNLASALEALMPADDYGSAAESAYDLGTLGGTSELSGLIGMLSDADYFRFTAAATGTVSFTATTTHGLTPIWTASGGSGAVSGSGGETYTFDVVGGQTYTLGLSTGGGLGYYNLVIDAQAAFSFTDWGVIAQTQINDQSIAGETWYRVQASRAGYLTAEAFFSAAAGDIDLAWFDANLQQVASGVGSADSERVDWLVSQGEELYLRVTGVNADVDFRLTNLVSLAGSTLTITGTTGADVFTFSAGATQHTITVNGVTYQCDIATVTTINFSGDAGSDAITMTGTAGNDTATLRAGNAQLVGSGYSAVADSIENVTVHSGGGTNDVTTFYDTTGNDTYTTWWNRAIMFGDGYWNDVRGFDVTNAYASQGYDRALFRDTLGTDTFTTWWNRAIMYGSGYWNDGRGFDVTYGFASEGSDRALLRDTTGNDVYSAWSDRAVMSGSGYSNEARGFDQTFGFASQGNDRADLYDSAGDDVYTAWWDRAVMSGTGFWNDARGFDRTNAYATGGYDRAIFYDTAGDDIYTSWWNRAIMYGDGYWNDARGFDGTNAYATQGNDRAVLRDSSAHDELHASGSIAYMTSVNYHNEAEGFDRVDACDIDGDGSDEKFVSAVDYLFNLLGDWT